MKSHLWPLALGSMLILIGATGSPTQAQEPEYGTFPPARQLTAQEILAFPTEQTEPVYKTVHPQTDGTSEGEASSWTPPDPADLPSAQRAFGYGPRLSTNFMGHVHHGEPADPHIAAGPDHLITVVNVQIKFWNKDGDNLQTTHLNDFFGVPGGEPGTFDPKVIYDKDSGRFFVLALAKNCTQGKSRYHLAASMTSNPMDGFHVYPAVDNMVANHWVDYPTLGVGERGLYIGGNLIPCSSPRTYERSLWVIDKSAVIAGLGAAVYKYHDVFPGLPTGQTLLMKAAVSWDSPTGVDNFVVSWNQLPGSVYQPMVWGVTVPGSFPSSAWISWKTWWRKRRRRSGSPRHSWAPPERSPWPWP